MCGIKGLGGRKVPKVTPHYPFGQPENLVRPVNQAVRSSKILKKR
jgi:hypothetical protein